MAVTGLLDGLIPWLVAAAENLISEDVLECVVFQVAFLVVPWFFVCRLRLSEPAYYFGSERNGDLEGGVNVFAAGWAAAFLGSLS